MLPGGLGGDQGPRRGEGSRSASRAQRELRVLFWAESRRPGPAAPAAPEVTGVADDDHGLPTQELPRLAAAAPLHTPMDMTNITPLSKPKQRDIAAGTPNKIDTQHPDRETTEVVPCGEPPQRTQG
ncbi:hypothetical protein CRUP_030585 [Coryphaenoides rupestris]|nr:hypothetical protein CRUP_030585 [Coryphaenoides rupestris]